MTILDRDTIIDRPELVTREDDDDEQDEGDEATEHNEPDTLGDGGGPEVHGLEFESDDLDVIAAANTCAVLTTGQEEGDVFERVFKNAAIQLRDMKVRNRDIDMISYFGLNNAIATVGLSEEMRNQTMNQIMQDDIQSEPETTDDVEDDTDEDETEDDEIDIEDVEEEVDDMTDEDEDTKEDE
jgi:hypothetical protein